MAALNALFMSIALLVMSSLTSCAEIKYSAGVSSTGSLMMTDSNGTSSPSHLMRRFPPHGTSTDVLEPDGLLDMQSNRSQTQAQAWVDIGCASKASYTGAWVDMTATKHNNKNIGVQCCKKSTTQCTFSSSGGSTTSGKGCVSNSVETGLTGSGNQYLTCTRATTKALRFTGSSSSCLGTGKTFSQASELCTGLGSGWELCSRTRMTVFKKSDGKELCCGTGCSYDGIPVWVNAH